MSVPPKKKCPVCAKPANPRFTPFCSGRCADLDLGKWLKGSYAIPGAVEETDFGAPAPNQGSDEE